LSVKSKSVLIDLPSVKFFDDKDEIVYFAKVINQFIHGKIKVKCEFLGSIGEKYVGLFYLKRNFESGELKDDVMKMINSYETANT